MHNYLCFQKEQKLESTKLYMEVAYRLKSVLLVKGTVILLYCYLVSQMRNKICIIYELLFFSVAMY